MEDVVYASLMDSDMQFAFSIASRYRSCGVLARFCDFSKIDMGSLAPDV